jgi:hypothetical protein
LKAAVFDELDDSVQVTVAAACSLGVQVAGEMLALEIDAPAGAATPISVPATTAIPTIAVIPRRIMLAFLTCAPMA